MTTRLMADFKRSFGPESIIHGRLEMPLDQFSITALFGPSGCGKTTVLRCLAGLDRPNSGAILGGDSIWFDAEKRIHIPPQHRDIGFCFQDHAIFPHLSIADNVGWGWHGPRAEKRRNVMKMLERFRIEELADRMPHQISGGQSQRVALARALMRRPRLLILDEPLSALDANLREELRRELRHFLAQFSVPTLLVTHDRLEALALADQVIVMNHGLVLQSGSVSEVFSRPSCEAVAHIMGIETVLEGTLDASREGLAVVSVGPAQLTALAPPEPARHVHVCIRGEDVTLSRQSETPSSSRNRLRCRITRIVPEGALLRISLDAGFALTATITRPAADELGLKLDDEVIALIKASSIHLVARR